MLVLSRKKEEVIMIGENIEIVVLDIKGDVVKIGIRAPKNVSVHRKEVYEEIQAENIKAAASAQLTDFDELLQLIKKDNISQNNE
ncbi:MAG: carbon storage regulator [Firmicutes bacterium HGW-Firmicutes-14]|nr:MAG: carbon storage regulator [Firmicutes bacterium HGW-Firmicutes-14]